MCFVSECVCVVGVPEYDMIRDAQYGLERCSPKCSTLREAWRLWLSKLANAMKSRVAVPGSSMNPLSSNRPCANVYSHT